MWNKAIPIAGLVAAVLLGACGGGGEKKAFAEYERIVEPILSAEAELRSQFDERVEDARAYAREAEVRSLIVNRMVPFYEEMDTKIAEIEPEGDRLREIHGVLEKYVELRGDFLRGFLASERRAEVLGEATAEVQDEVDLAWGKVETAGTALNEAASAAGEVSGELAPVFQEERATTQGLQAAMEMVSTGRIPPDQFRAALEDRFRPAYAGFRKRVDAFDISRGGMELVLAAKEYLEAMEGVLDAAEKLGETVADGPSGDAPGDAELSRLWQRAEETRRIYLEDAKEYRSSLR